MSSTFLSGVVTVAVRKLEFTANPAPIHSSCLPRAAFFQEIRKPKTNQSTNVCSTRMSLVFLSPLTATTGSSTKQWTLALPFGVAACVILIVAAATRHHTKGPVPIPKRIALYANHPPNAWPLTVSYTHLTLPTSDLV